MIEQTNCVGCGKRFFGDTEKDWVGEKPYCSWCLPRVRQCAVCGDTTILSKDSGMDVGICSSCRFKHGEFPNLYLTLRYITLQRDAFSCRYCGRSPLTEPGVVLHCDHIVPKSRGGENKIENLITSCRECNMGKLDIMLEEKEIHKLINRRTVENGTEIDKDTSGAGLNKVGDSEATRCVVEHNKILGEGCEQGKPEEPEKIRSPRKGYRRLRGIIRPQKDKKIK